MIDDVQERQNLHAIEQTQSHGEAVGSMASRRRLMFWFEAEIKDIRTRHDQAQDVRCSSATSSRNNLLQQKRPRQFSPAAYPHKRRVCAATGSILLPSPRGREHLAPLDCRRRAVRVQRRHSDRLGRQLLPARRPRDQPCRYASARDGRRASRVARAPSSAATAGRGSLPSVAAGTAAAVSLRRSSCTLLTPHVRYMRLYRPLPGAQAQPKTLSSVLLSLALAGAQKSSHLLQFLCNSSLRSRQSTHPSQWTKTQQTRRPASGRGPGMP